MPSAYRSLVIPSPVEEVWAVARRFNGLPDWHPIIAASSLESGGEDEVGAVRKLTTPDGAEIVERLVELDDDQRRMIYTILTGPFPVENYVSTIHVAPVADSDETFAEWFAQFDCEPAVETDMTATFGDGVFGAGLDALREHVGAS